MRRPVLLLNLLLAGAVVYAGMELRARWKEARDREAAALAYRAPAAPVAVPNVPPPPAPARFQAGQYFEVAERFLFARDRNPNVVIEKPAPPPKKVMPAMPYVHGVMDLGLGPTVFLSLDGKTQESHKVGDKVGEFQLMAANNKQITFEWDGQKIEKPLEELKPPVNESAPPPANVSAGQTSVGYRTPPPTPPPKPPENVRPAPGNDIGGGRKSCIAGDTSPTGTVADGYRKVSTSYAFGPICYWEPTR